MFLVRTSWMFLGTGRIRCCTRTNSQPAEN